MSEADQDIQSVQRMPDRSQRVREALLRFESASQRPGSVLELADDQLFEVGLLLSDPSLSIADALRKTNETLGGAELSKSAFYRFADRFKALLNQVTAEYAQRIARLTVDEATDSRIHDMTRISRFRLGELIAEKLVSTDNLDEVAKLLPKLATIVAAPTPRCCPLSQPPQRDPNPDRSPPSANAGGGVLKPPPAQGQAP